MIIDQFVLPSLGHASYLIGSERTGRALVLDPRRDVDVYIDAARRRGLRIAYALDTHMHNDYVSGILELASRTGAELLASAMGTVEYPHRPLAEGDAIELGEAVLRVLHTPGHTPEHISLLAYEGSDEPAILFSGGALLVGDIARPDLLGGPDDKREAARTFCRVIQEKILALPDHVLVYPVHVAGSLCAASIGSRTCTTIGYEKRTNPTLAAVAARDVFVEECLRTDDLPAVPPYWRRMRRENQRGAPPLGAMPEPPSLDVEAFAQRAGAGAVVLDARAPEAYAGGHIPAALNVGLGPGFPTWAGTVLPPDREVLLVVDRADDVREATVELLRIGYGVPGGWLAPGMRGWQSAGRPVQLLDEITVEELARRLEDFTVLDVRQPAEWTAGHIERAVFITGAEVPERIGDVPARGPLAVTCGTGYRSSAVASLLLHHGRRDVVNVVGGMGAWRAAGLPTVSA